MPHYKSFNTSRKVTGVDSMLCREGTSSETVTVAIPTGRLAESSDRASEPLPDSGPVETAAAEAGPSSRRRKKLVGPVAAPSAAIVINDSPPGFTPRAEGQDRPAEVAEERRAEKRARVEILPGPSSSKSLEVEEVMLKEEAGRNVGLAADLEQAQVMVEHLREEAKEEATQNAPLSADIDSARVELVRLEEDLQSTRRVNKRLISQRNQAKGELDMALREKATELEYALSKQKVELKEKYVAELDDAMGEKSRKLAADYKAQLPGIRDRAWELGWKAALKKVGIFGDRFFFRNPPRFPSSDSDLHYIIDSPLVLSSSQVPPAANAAPEVPPEAPPTASAVPEASSEAPPTASAMPEAVPVVSETVLVGPKESAAVSKAGAPQGIDCNVEAVAPLSLSLHSFHCIFL
ncbi:hypothetical protein AAC387_Pa12g0599 [Persea americana]